MNKEERQEEVIQSALALFIEKGYKGTTTSEIAKMANISEVTLFRHFKSKEELFMAGVKPILQVSLNKMKLDPSLNSFEDQLKDALLHRIMYITHHHDVIKLILNEHILLADYANLIEQMVQDLQETLFSYDIKKNIELKQRLLMGMFLSYLYHPETDKIKIKAYIELILNQLIDR